MKQAVVFYWLGERGGEMFRARVFGERAEPGRGFVG